MAVSTLVAPPVPGNAPFTVGMLVAPAHESPAFPRHVLMVTKNVNNQAFEGVTVYVAKYDTRDDGSRNSLGLRNQYRKREYDTFYGHITLEEAA